MVVVLLLWLAAAQPDPVEAYRACIEVEDSLERLRCFDRAGEADPGGQLVEAAPASSDRQREESAALAAARIAEAERAAALAEQRARTAEAELSEARRQRRSAPKSEPKRYQAAVTEIFFGPRGKLTVRLDNGEIWDQLDSDDTKVPEGRADRIRTVTIKPAALGGRRMEIEPLGKTIRVRLRS
jgi:hypothetical protein